MSATETPEATIPPEPVATPQAAIVRLCQLVEEAHEHLGYHNASDCFCKEGGMWDNPTYSSSPSSYSNSGVVLAWVERVVRERIASEGRRGQAPASTEAPDLARIREQGTTVLLVEQNALAALAVADRAYVLESGALKLHGDAADLVKDNEIVAAYLGG